MSDGGAAVLFLVARGFLSGAPFCFARSAAFLGEAALFFFAPVVFFDARRLGAGAFLVAAFLVAAFLVVAFLVVAFLVVAFLVAAFLVAPFLVAPFLVAAFFRAGAAVAFFFPDDLSAPDFDVFELFVFFAMGGRHYVLGAALCGTTRL